MCFYPNANKHFGYRFMCAKQISCLLAIVLLSAKVRHNMRAKVQERWQAKHTKTFHLLFYPNRVACIQPNSEIPTLIFCFYVRPLYSICHTFGMTDERQCSPFEKCIERNLGCVYIIHLKGKCKWVAKVTNIFTRQPNPKPMMRTIWKIFPNKT